MRKLHFWPMVSITFLAMVFLSSSAWAVPGYINYQGQLTGPDGLPVDNPALNMTFRIFDSETNGALLWEAAQTVDVQDGIYNIKFKFSEIMSPGLFNNEQLYLEVEVEGESGPMTPRQRLTSVPFAMRAGTADKLGDLEVTDLQQQVWDSCGDGSSIKIIYSDGTVECNNLADHATIADHATSADMALSAADAETLDGMDSTALDQSEHVGNTANPHGVTAAQVGAIAVETDPTVIASVKNGVSWSEILEMPPSFADNIDNNSGGDITGVIAGDGLSGGGFSGLVTLDVSAPLNLSGSATTIYPWGPQGAVVAGENSHSGPLATLGGYFSASGTAGVGIYGYASDSGSVTNYGGYFSALGSSGRGVYGSASNEGSVTNYGGYFRAAGRYGRGIYGTSSNDGNYTNYGGYFTALGSTGRGVYGEATATGAVRNYGGNFMAAGDQGRGVYGGATATGNVTNYGGKFAADGDYGHGVFGYAPGSSGIGVYGEASSEARSNKYGGKFFAAGGDGRGVYGEASYTGATINYGGKFLAAGTSGRGVYGEASNTADVTNYGGYFLAAGTYGVGVYASGGSSGYAAEFKGNVRIISQSSDITIMELGEGLDYAEGFDVSGHKNIKPGAVMIIDPENPGKLTLSCEPYDTKVAGIVAGANGLGSGVRLGAGQFDKDVALAGRVYCNVDATKHSVETGDLLTTSDILGYAMKAADYGRAQGAILGKAMEKLDKGEKGQILVLVTLQ